MFASMENFSAASLKPSENHAYGEMVRHYDEVVMPVIKCTASL